MLRRSVLALILALSLSSAAHAAYLPGPVVGQAPAGQFVLAPTAMTGSPDGARLAALDPGVGRVTVFAADGSVVRAFGARGPAATDISGVVSDVAVGDDGTGWAVATAPNRLVRFPAAGAPTSVALPAQGRSIAIDGPTGEVHVLVLLVDGPDVLVFSPAGALLRTVDLDVAPGSFLALALRPDRYAVTDTGGSRVVLFDRAGEFLSAFGSAGSGEGQFGFIQGIAPTAVGWAVADSATGGRVQRFSDTGTYAGTHTNPGYAVADVAALGDDLVQAAIFSSAARPLLRRTAGTGVGTFARSTASIGLVTAPDDIALRPAGSVAMGSIHGTNSLDVTALRRDGSGGLIHNALGGLPGLDFGAGALHLLDQRLITRFAGDAAGTPVWNPSMAPNGAIAVGADGSIYAFDPAAQTVRRYGADGAPSTTTFGSGHTRVPAIALAPDGTVLTLAVDRVLRRFSADGTPRDQLSLTSDNPSGMAVDDRGDVYISRRATATVTKHDATSLAVIATFGGRGNGPGQFTTADVSGGIAESALDVSPDGRSVALLDEGSQRLVFFDGEGPQTAIAGGPPAVTREPAPTLALTATPSGGATFECRVDGGPWTACGSSWTPPALSEGSHVLAARAIGPDHLEDLTPASRDVVVDTTAPAIDVRSAPEGTIATASVTVDFAVTDATAVTTDCALDGEQPRACSSPASFEGLAEGAHVVAIGATDAAGNRTVVERRFTVDLPDAGGSAGAGAGGGGTQGSGSPQPIVKPAAPAVRIGTVRADRRGRALVTVRCAGPAACAGALVVRAGRRVAGRGRFALAPGRSGVARIRLSTAARRSLARRGRLGVVVQARPTGGAPATRRATLRKPR